MQTSLTTYSSNRSQIYKRNWSLYNISQTSEKIIALRILNDAVNSLNIPYEYSGRGRPPIGIDDMIKCCVIKVFNCFSSRRSIPDLEMARALSHIRQVPHFNIICKYLRSKEIVDYLHQLYERLALPLKMVEDTFAVDATGFGTFKKNWLDSKGWFKPRPVKVKWRDFKKLHITCGTRTTIITAAEASHGSCHDSPYFIDLIRDTARKFDVKRVCADAGYLSKQNCQAVKDVGGRPFIMPKANTRERTIRQYKKKLTPWREMVWFWINHKQLFEQYYHQRSNVESAFSAMKRKFLPYIRSKDTQAQFNELICKVICHNLSVLVNSIFELDLIADFNKFTAELEVS